MDACATIPFFVSLMKIASPKSISFTCRLFESANMMLSLLMSVWMSDSLFNSLRAVNNWKNRRKLPLSIDLQLLNWSQIKEMNGLPALQLVELQVPLMDFLVDFWHQCIYPFPASQTPDSTDSCVRNSPRALQSDHHYYSARNARAPAWFSVDRHSDRLETKSCDSALVSRMRLWAI